MSRLTTVRKKAIKTHLVKMEIVQTQLTTIINAVDVLGLAGLSEKLNTIAQTIRFELLSLETTAEITKPDP